MRFWRIMKTYHLLASVMFHVPGKGVSKSLCAIASLTAVMASAALGIEVFGAPTKALYEQQRRVTFGNAAFIERFLYLSGITCCLSLFIKLFYALIYWKPIGLVWYSKPQYRHDGKRDSQVIKTETETWLTNKKPLPYEPEIHPHWLLRRMYFPYRQSALFTSKEERSDVDGMYAVSPGVNGDSGIIHFGTKHILETPRLSVDSTEASFARHSIQKEDDGNFSMIESTSLRSSFRTASEASKSPRGSVVKSEIATIVAMLKTSAEPKETTIEQPVKGKAKGKLFQGLGRFLTFQRRENAAGVEVLNEDRNKNRDDSGLDDYGLENYQRNCASSQSNVSCNLSGFTHLPTRVRNTSKTLRLNSENDKKIFSGRENLDSEKPDICQSRSSLRSVSEVNLFDGDEQGIWTVALCPLSPIPARADHNKECSPGFSNAKDNTADKRLEVASFSHPPYRECTKRYNIRPSRLIQPYVPSFRFSRGLSYFDKLMKNHNRRCDKELLHEKSTGVHNSTDRNYRLRDLSADHNHLRCLKAASKSVGVDEDACLGTDICSDTNTFRDVSHGWSETNTDTFKTRCFHGGKRKHDVNGSRCLLSMTAVGKYLIHSFCCIVRFLLLITSCMSRRTKERKENSLAGIRLDGFCTPPNLNRTPQEASYSVRRISNIRQGGQGQNYKAIRDNYCENWTIDSDTNYSARDQVENREQLLKGSSVDETDMFGRTPWSGPGSRIDHYKPTTESMNDQQRETKYSDSDFSTESLCMDHFCDCLFSIFNRMLDLLRLIVLLVSVCIIIFSTGWVTFNGLHYSFLLSVDWFVLMVTVLLFELIVLEPCILLCCAAVSTRLWKTPDLIRESTERFKVVSKETFHRDCLIDMSFAERHRTSFVHTQAAPDSSGLYYLLDKIYSAFKKTKRLPDVVFESGVYWLIIYTLCTIVLINLNTDIQLGNRQSNVVHTALGLSPAKRAITVDQIWTFVEQRLIVGLLDLEDKVMVQAGQFSNTTIEHFGFGYMLISPVQFHQIRVRPFSDSERPCSPLTSVDIQKERQCNYEYSAESMETGNFDSDWDKPTDLDVERHYSNPPVGYRLITIDNLPLRGYKFVMIIGPSSYRELKALKESDWIDEHTRFLLIDFSLMNAHTHMASTVRIRFDFRRSAPVWYSYSFHFIFELTGNQLYFFIIVGIFFLILSAYNVLKQILLVYKSGLILHLQDYESYIELLKVLLSILLSVVFFRMNSLNSRFVKNMRRSHESRGQNSPEFFDSFELAALDYVYRIAGGFLAFICIFQIFEMLKKIRRLLVFMRLLVSVFMLFYMPLIVGMAFAILALIMFGNASETFADLLTSYLTINQYFVKPRAIYHTLLENSPFFGPWFVFILGLCINFFILNFFIVFLNEAYSFVMNKIRLQAYKVLEKTRLEYVYEFLGIQSTIKWDIDLTTLEHERELDRDFMADVKRFAAN